MSSVIVELKHLKKYYGTARGVEDVSLKIQKGEIYGFIGPNGAGKSTTIRIIMGLIHQMEGEVVLFGDSLHKEDIVLKKRIGYLPSEIHLYDGMSVGQLFDYHESFYQGDLKKRRKELVKMFKIDEQKKIGGLSLGNLKKVGIVLAFMHEPELLILDEPTSGLDPIMQNVFHDLLLKEKEKGTTILYSSHVLSEVSNICDRVGFIKDGKIIKEDTIKNIKKDNYTYLKITSDEISKIKKELKLEVLSENGTEVVFLNCLEPNELLTKLSKYHLKQLFIEEVPLEDLFMNYYK